MIKKNLLVTTAATALIASFAAAPALAEDDENGASPVDSEAQGTFAGFTASPTIVARSIDEMSITLDQPQYIRTSRGLTGSPIGPDPEIIVRDDVGLPASVDVNDTVPFAVQLFRRDNTSGGVFFNCSGSLINPRTVLTAAHCVNSAPSESYGLGDVADQTILVTTGVNSADRIFPTIFGGATYEQGGAAQSTDVIIHPSSNLENGGLRFPWADVALIALDTPITDTPTGPILLTPLDRLTHVVQVGYGTVGTGLQGSLGSTFLRRIGENTLGASASIATFLDAVFPSDAPHSQNFGAESQVYYFTDFDNPDRTPAEEAGCIFTGDSISCNSIGAVRAIDWFDGDALPNEVGTAPGDSGSPLIVDELYDFPVITGVLSGGFDFFRLGNQYGDISFYNPLFPFFEFISENTPYKYVSAKAGNGNWSDASHWTQDLDPGFFIDDGSGNLINGIPEGPEPGVFATGPTLGTVLGQDITGQDSDLTPGLPPEGTPNFGGNLPASSALLGPGSTGFVPNNTDGTPGTAFENPALYFDVLLTAPGTTTVDLDVEIDRLTVDGAQTGFDLDTPYSLTSLIGVEQWRGSVNVDGTLITPLVLQLGGTFGGNGTVVTDVFFNTAGGITPGGDNAVGNLTIDGNYVQSSDGVYVVDIRNRRGNLSADLLSVTGAAVLDGTLFVFPTARGRLRYGDQFTVLEAGLVDGEFSQVLTQSNSPVLFFDQVVTDTSVSIEVQARSIRQVVGQNSGLASVGATLDALRFGGRYDQFANLFAAVDGSGFDQFGATLLGLTPTSGFAQSATANNFAMRFTGQVAQRTLALRGADNAAAGFSSFGAASFAQAGDVATASGQLGFFGSVSGSYLVPASERSTGTRAFEESAFRDAGELTVGADIKLTDDLSVGLAVSSVRDGATGNPQSAQPLGNESLSTAAYAAMTFGNGFADMYVGFAQQRFGLERGGQGLLEEQFQSATGLADGQQSLAGLRVGYTLSPAKGISVGPVASIDFVRSDLEGFQELRAGEFGLNVHDRSLTSIGAKVGMMGTADIELGQKSRISAFGSVAYARELGDLEDVVRANFVGAEDLPFSISRELVPDWVSVTGGAEMQISDNFSASVSVSTDTGRGVLNNHQGQASVRWRF